MATGSQSRAEIRSLTGLRGVAASFVVFYHALHSGPAIAGILLDKGYLCVDLFFVLSGYVMALNYKPLFSDGQGSFGNYFKFLWLRFARIYPLYFVITLLVAASNVAGLMPLFDVPRLWSALIWNLLLLQGMSFGAGNVNLAAWSISTEWFAYLAFPALVGFILKGSEARVWWSAGFAVVALILVVALGPAAQPAIDGPLSVFGTNTPAPILRCLGGFALGMAIFGLKDSRFAQWFSGRPLHADIVAGTMVVTLFLPQGDVPFVVLCALFILHLSKAQASTTSQFLSGGLAYYLGEISYSLYLVHVPVILILRHFFEARGWSWTIASCLGIVLSFALAPLAYRYIELPGRKLLRSMTPGKAWQKSAAAP
jgi:peptidoglycan/LPS O-acetylase OafA/YrhL